LLFLQRLEAGGWMILSCKIPVFFQWNSVGETGRRANSFEIKHGKFAVYRLGVSLLG